MAVNAYLKFEEPGITGSSSADNHVGEIEILSWSQGFSQPGSRTRSTSGGGTVERVNVEPLSFTKYLDKSTRDLLKHLYSGKQIGKATISVNRADGATDNKPVEYLKVVMEKVLIADYQLSGSEGDIPVERISLDPGTLQYNYIEQKTADGTADSNMPIKIDLIAQKVE